MLSSSMPLSKHTLPAFAIALLLVLPASGQISFGGQPWSRSAGRELPTSPVVTMPSVDANALMAEDEEREAQGIKGPFRFGFNHMVDLSLENSGLWYDLPNGDRMWRVTLECPEAYSINFEFHDYFIPEGARVFVYNENGALGAFTMGSSGGMESLGVAELAGDRITIEYDEPASVQGQGRLRIGQVTHAYRDITGSGTDRGLGDSGPCHNNVRCPKGGPWGAQIRSAVSILVNGSHRCSGVLLNNCEQDGTPYVLTARHCRGIYGASPANWIYRWGWESPYCEVNESGPTHMTMSNSLLLMDFPQTDVMLVRVVGDVVPPEYDPYYSGWDKSGTPPVRSVGIHHPRGDVKKITFDNDTAIMGTFYGSPCWQVVAWDDGTTEPGSSGSGLWNEKGLVVGQLYGGDASCNNMQFSDFYGRFDLSYPFMKQWLGDCGDELGGYPRFVSSVDEAADKAQGLSLSPNPTNGLLLVSLPEDRQSAAGSLVLRDALGRTVVERSVPRGTERLTLDLGKVPEGIYLLELLQGAQRTVERVVLDR